MLNGICAFCQAINVRCKAVSGVHLYELGLLDHTAAFGRPYCRVMAYIQLGDELVELKGLTTTSTSMDFQRELTKALNCDEMRLLDYRTYFGGKIVSINDRMIKIDGGSDKMQLLFSDNDVRMLGDDVRPDTRPIAVFQTHPVDSIDRAERRTIGDETLTRRLPSVFLCAQCRQKHDIVV